MLPTVEAPRRKRLRDGINHIAYSVDGQRYAYADVHMFLVVPWGFSRSLCSLNEKVRPTERIRDVVFSRDGKSVLVAAGDHVWQFDSETGEEQWRYMPPRVLGFLIVSPLALAVADSGLVAASTDNGQFLVWNADRTLAMKYAANESQMGLAFAGKTDELVTFEHFAINRYDVGTRRRTVRFELPDKTYGMALSPDGDFAAVRTLSHVFVLNAHTGEVLTQRNVEPGLPLLAFHPTRSMIAIGENYFVSLVDLDGAPIERVEVEDAEVISLAFHPSGETLAIGRSNHQIQLHQL